MSLANLRGDTPLHHAARWNHPMLVNELLLYGASYTATNNKDATPGDLTSDDQVLDIIRKAMSGQLVVGSYSPLTQSYSQGEHRKYSSGHHKSSVSDAPSQNHDGSSLERSDGHAQSVPSPVKSDNAVSLESSGSKSSSFEYVQAPEPEPEAGSDSQRGVVQPGTDAHDVGVESYEVIEASEREMEVTVGTTRAEEGGLWTDSEEEEKGNERRENRTISTDEEHRTLSGQERVSGEEYW